MGSVNCGLVGVVFVVVREISWRICAMMLCRCNWPGELPELPRCEMGRYLQHMGGKSNSTEHCQLYSKLL